MEESPTDVAAVRLYRVRLTLSGTTLFCNNSGGGLDITQGRVDVVAMVTFEENTAALGGAMRLFGQTEVSNNRGCFELCGIVFLSQFFTTRISPKCS